MSWGRSPSQGLGALGRSPFKGSSPRPFAPGESSSSSSSSGGSSSRDLGGGGGGGGGGGNGQGSEWMLLDERVSRGPASCSPGTSASREFLMMAEHRRRSMSLDIPQHQHHQQQQQHHNQHHHLQGQHHHPHHQPPPPHRPSSGGAFSSSPGGNFPSSLSREFSGLSTGTGNTTTSATSNHSYRDRSSSGIGSMLDGSGSGSASASGSTTGSVGALRSGGTSSSSSSSVASASETSTATGATGAGGSESKLQRQFRARLEEAEQQTAYWQARAKEAEQAALKSKTECVTLRCQLNAQQCTAASLDEVLVSMHARVERIREGVGATAGAAAGMGVGRRGGAGGGGDGGDSFHSRPSVLESIELGLMALEKKLVEGGTVGGGRGGGRGGAAAGAKDVGTMTTSAAAPSSPPSSPPSLPASVIHFRRFSPGDLALFFPTPAGDYLAFNVGCPHHYLSEESKAMIGKDKHFRKYYVLGRITRLVKCQVPTVEDVQEKEGGREGGRGGSKGPYDLAGGCRYAVVSVEPIKSLSESTSSSSSSRRGGGLS